MTIITMAAAGITAVLLAVQLKGVKGEYGIYMVIAAGFFIFFYGVGKLAIILETLEKIISAVRMNQVYFHALLKMVGIAYVAEFSSGICKDAGYSAIGTQIEIFGKLSILAVSMPVFMALIETMERFLA
ncbi:SpoIIIAC/SpoIIIAD family protein [Lachnospiraceae bacterium 62-35]